MLHRLHLSSDSCTAPVQDPLFSRNQKEDMKQAIEYLYEFREKLAKLHPTCTDDNYSNQIIKGTADVSFKH